MSRRVILPTALSNRRQPLLLHHSESYRKASTRLMGEAVGGTAAVCCCFSFGLANMIYLAMYKVPAKLCQKALRRKRGQRHRHENLMEAASLDQHGTVPPRPRCTCGCCDDIIGATGRGYPLCCDDGDVAVMRRRSSAEKDNDEVELENEMWDRFYGSGFWRSPSQRDNNNSSSQQQQQQQRIVTFSSAVPPSSNRQVLVS